MKPVHWALVAAGTTGAIITGITALPPDDYRHYRQYRLDLSGVALPFFYVLMGEMIDQLNVDNSEEYESATRTLCFSFLTIGCITLLSGFLQVCLLAWSVLAS